MGKIIKMNGNNSQHNTNKIYSSYLEKIYEKYSGEIIHKLDSNTALEIMVNSWNLGNMTKLLSEEFIDDMLSKFPHQEFIDVAKKIINYKIRRHKNDNLYIENYNFELTNGEIKIILEATEQEYFFNTMGPEHLDNLGFDDIDLEEDEFTEGFINRSLLIIKPKPAFFDWLNKKLSELEFDDEIRSESTAYLVDEEAHEIDPVIWLKLNYPLLLEKELSKFLYTPEEILNEHSYTQFKKWFSIRFIEDIFDTLPEPLFKNNFY